MVALRPSERDAFRVSTALELPRSPDNKRGSAPLRGYNSQEAVQTPAMTAKSFQKMEPLEKRLLTEPMWTAPKPAPKPLHICMQSALESYFQHLAGEVPRDLYALALREIELPLLQAVLGYTRGNHSRAAEVLGINRGTLRKKLRAYGLTLDRP